MRDSVVIYRSFYEASKTLSPEEYKELWSAIFDYSLNDQEPEAIRSPLANAIFTMAQPQIDANKKRHDDGAKGGRPKKPVVIEDKNQWLLEKKPNVNVNVNVNDNVNVNEEKKTRTKEEKHIYGEYKHVRLTNAQFEKLAADFGEDTRAAAIKKLDEYIQEKPTYKSQDHNLAIRRWVLKALEEEKQKAKPAITKFHNFDNKHEYDFEEMERQLLGG